MPEHLGGILSIENRWYRFQKRGSIERSLDHQYLRAIQMLVGKTIVSKLLCISMLRWPESGSKGSIMHYKQLSRSRPSSSRIWTALRFETAFLSCFLLHSSGFQARQSPRVTTALGDAISLQAQFLGWCWWKWIYINDPSSKFGKGSNK
jgi:hypothetical protein